MKKLKLSDDQIKTLTKLPETGMGYQKVILGLNNGKILKNMTVLNSEDLLIEDEQNINRQDILNIELERNY